MPRTSTARGSGTGKGEGRRGESRGSELELGGGCNVRCCSRRCRLYQFSGLSYDQIEIPRSKTLTIAIQMQQILRYKPSNNSKYRSMISEESLACHKSAYFFRGLRSLLRRTPFQPPHIQPNLCCSSKCRLLELSGYSTVELLIKYKFREVKHCRYTNATNLAIEPSKNTKYCSTISEEYLLSRIP